MSGGVECWSLVVAIVVRSVGTLVVVSVVVVVLMRGLEEFVLCVNSMNKIA